MELRELIESAAKIAGSQTALAKVIGVRPDQLTHAKAAKAGLPEVACGKLAEVLGIDRWTVVAASALVTEKNPEKRAYLSPFVHTLPRKAATWIIGIATAATLTTAPTDTYASDTLNVSLAIGAPTAARDDAMPMDLLPIMRRIKWLIIGNRSFYSTAPTLRRYAAISSWPSFRAS